MIFEKEYIEMIRKGMKTQTRRVNRCCYQEGKDYVVLCSATKARYEI